MFITAIILALRSIIFNILGTGAEGTQRAFSETVLTFIFIAVGFLILFLPLDYLSSIIHDKKDSLSEQVKSNLQIFEGSWSKEKGKLASENLAALMMFNAIASVKEFPIDFNTSRKLALGGLTSVVLTAIELFMPV